MVPDSSPNTTVATQTEKDSNNTLVNAVIGAAAGIILSFIPFSTLLGGAIAGYLEDGEFNNGVKVGAIAGGIMLIPFVLIGVFIMIFFLGFGSGGSSIAFGIMALFILFISAVYTVGLSILGGILGIYLRDELGH